MAWTIPEEINKEEDLSKVDNERLIYYHDNMHIFWKKVEEGFYGAGFEWSFDEIYFKHRETFVEMLKRKLIHLEPINNLDKISIVHNIKELKDLVKEVKSFLKKKKE